VVLLGLSALLTPSLQDPGPAFSALGRQGREGCGQLILLPPGKCLQPAGNVVLAAFHSVLGPSGSTWRPVFLPECPITCRTEEV